MRPYKKPVRVFTVKNWLKFLTNRKLSEPGAKKWNNFQFSTVVKRVVKSSVQTCKRFLLKKIKTFWVFEKIKSMNYTIGSSG